MMNANPDFSSPQVFECDLEESPEKVWLALTDPLLLEAWLSTDALPVASPGIESAQRGPGEKDAGASECEILTAEPHRFLRYRWRDRESGVGEERAREVQSVVTIELAPCPTGGTHLRLTHGEFRVVSLAPVMTAARIVPIMSGRRRKTPIVSSAMQACLRRAA